jgi:hypothetical protein
MRKDRPRFKVTEIVEISSDLRSPLSGRKARIVEIRENRLARTLDKYVVLLEGSTDQQLLWDIELKPITAIVKNRS